MSVSTMKGLLPCRFNRHIFMILCVFMMVWVPYKAMPLDTCQKVCRDEENISLYDRCPKEGSCSWHCAAERFKRKHGKCELQLMYTCGRNVKYANGNLTFLGHIEACVHENTCANGTLPAIITSINNMSVNLRAAGTTCVPCEEGGCGEMSTSSYLPHTDTRPEHSGVSSRDYIIPIFSTLAVIVVLVAVGVGLYYLRVHLVVASVTNVMHANGEAVGDRRQSSNTSDNADSASYPLIHPCSSSVSEKHELQQSSDAGAVLTTRNKNSRVVQLTSFDER